MSSNIFINYRRGEDSGVAGRLFDRLEHRFSRNKLFMDVDSIEPGLDFISILKSQVANCEILLALIGRGWLSASDEEGRRRLADPSDFVRIEIASALTQGKRVIPVLIGPVTMPRDEDLPEDLKPLARRHAFRLTHENFNADVERLIKVLSKALTAVEEQAQRKAEEEAEQRALEWRFQIEADTEKADEDEQPQCAEVREKRPQPEAVAKRFLPYPSPFRVLIASPISYIAADICSSFFNFISLGDWSRQYIKTKSFMDYYFHVAGAYNSTTDHCFSGISCIYSWICYLFRFGAHYEDIPFTAYLMILLCYTMFLPVLYLNWRNDWTLLKAVTWGIIACFLPSVILSMSDTRAFTDNLFSPIWGGIAYVITFAAIMGNPFFKARIATSQQNAD